MTRLKRVVYTICALLIIFALWNQRRLNRAEDNARELQQELSDVAHSSSSSVQDTASVNEQSEDGIKENTQPEDATSEDSAKDTTQQKDASSEDASKENGQPENISTGGGLVALNPWIDELHDRNEDLIGWLKIPDTVIDYPVVQTEEDKDYYLNHNFDGMSDSHGTLYADVDCWIGAGSNLIIYGHHMADGTMFQDLTKYQSPDFCRSNGDITFSTRDTTRYFRPVAVMRISVKEARKFPYHTVTELNNNDEYKEFFKCCKRYADWMAKKRPEYPTMLLTLSTCEYSKKNSRLVVVCACTGMKTASDSQNEESVPESTKEQTKP